jgi:pimeloyl-ACP methyl ester carboxylesterase
MLDDLAMQSVIVAPGLMIAEHSFDVPLDHDREDDRQVTIFAREVADPEGRDRPFLVYFQGGPGFEAPRPTRHPSAPSWLDRALGEFRVLMLDQRGTGRSSPAGALVDLTPRQQAEYLTHFRADSIVRDAEYIRRQLGVERWSVLGQSFGGFCVATYLSLAPGGLREAFITGGLPPLRRNVDDVYVHTYQRVLERNRQYFKRYPEDRQRVRVLRAQIDDRRVQLPCGDWLTWRRFRQLGSMLGMSDGAERLHYILELPLDSPAFLHDVERAAGFARNPLYAVLHEASYADGCATRWSAQRTLPPEFDEADLLTGEHVYPWMFDDYAALAPLREAAELLAEHRWPPLYDPEVLAANEVPAAAAIYSEDMYVERAFSENTADVIRGLRTWVTNEYQHNGLGIAGGHILSRLVDLARGRA